MKTLFKHFIISYFTAKNLSKNQGVIKFLNIFIIRFFYAFNFIRKYLNKNNYSFQKIESMKYFKKNISNEKVLKDLNSSGYNDYLNLKKKYLSQIKKEISLKNSSISFKSSKTFNEFMKVVGRQDGLASIIKKSQKKKVPHVAIDIDLKKTKKLKELATSKFFIELSKKYLNPKKISIASQCYISNPVKISEKDKKDNAQYFHYDNDYRKFFKVFIYLNDVDLSAGPHSFVAKTNTKKYFKHLLAERIDDNEVKKSYDNKNIKTFKGKEGKVIVEDTFGLHKGTSPSSKSRVMLILIYGHGQGINNYKNLLIKRFKS